MKLFWVGLIAVLSVSGIGYVFLDSAGADPDHEIGKKRNFGGKTGKDREERMRVQPEFVLRGMGLDRLIEHLFRGEIVADPHFIGSLRELPEEDKGALFRAVYDELISALAQHRGRTFTSYQDAVTAFGPLVRHVKRTISNDPGSYLRQVGALRFSQKDREEFVEVFLDAFTDERDTAQAVESLEVQEVQKLYRELARQADSDLLLLVGRSFSSVKEKQWVARRILEALRHEVTRHPRSWLLERDTTASPGLPDED
ncbi:MAG: hypothetical protein QF752_02745 [Planctomycetota bacterium]|nr:hypothetical protein [Planctomycetota bacterium]